MGRLIYLTQTSLDGFIGDGDYSWSAPDEEVMAALNANLAEVGAHLYGRRTYETVIVWEADPAWAEQSPEDAKFASKWQAADKVVFSSTLAQVHTRRPVGTAARRAGGGRDQGGEHWRRDHRGADAGRGRVAAGPGELQATYASMTVTRRAPAPGRA